MNHLKMLGLLAVAAAALTGFPADVSATVATSPAGTVYTGAVEAAGTVVLTTVTKTECVKKVYSSIVADGTNVTTRASISNMTFTNCSGADTVTVVNNGTMEYHSTGGGGGTITLSGSRIKKVIHSLGLTCEFTANETYLGTFTGSKSTGGNAVLDVESSKIPRTGGSIFCGSSLEMAGSMQFSSPSYLDLS